MSIGDNSVFEPPSCISDFRSIVQCTSGFMDLEHLSRAVENSLLSCILYLHAKLCFPVFEPPSWIFGCVCRTISRIAQLNSYRFRKYARVSFWIFCWVPYKLILWPRGNSSEESEHARDGCKFDESWQCRTYIPCSWIYDYSGPSGVLLVHMAWYKNCVKK